MARYCTIDQYHQAARRIREWKPEAGIDTLRKLLLIVMSILNHEDKVDTRVHIVKDLPRNLPNYGNCVDLIQSVYDTPTIDTTQVAILMDYVDSYIDLRSEQTDKSSEQQEQFAKKVTEVLHGISKLLIEKNRMYGNSALDPKRVFSTANPIEQLKVRIDSKINRIRNGSINGDGSYDSIKDLMGYLVLLLIALKRQSK